VFETTLKETFDNYWRGVALINTHLFIRNPKNDLSEVTTINDLAGKSTNFLSSLSNFAKDVVEMTSTINMSTLVESGTTLFKSIPVIKTFADKMNSKYEQKTGIISENKRLENFQKSFSDSEDAKHYQWKNYDRTSILY
jgi:hypothetical protein